MTQLFLVLKLLAVSLAITLVIKYIAPYGAIPASDRSALVGILLPTVVMAIVLGLRSRGG
jgi:hypothetical protein